MIQQLQRYKNIWPGDRLRKLRSYQFIWRRGLMQLLLGKFEDSIQFSPELVSSRGSQIDLHFIPKKTKKIYTYIFPWGQSLLMFTCGSINRDMRACVHELVDIDACLLSLILFKLPCASKKRLEQNSRKMKIVCTARSKITDSARPPKSSVFIETH